MNSIYNGKTALGPWNAYPHQPLFCSPQERDSHVIQGNSEHYFAEICHE